MKKQLLYTGLILLLTACNSSFTGTSRVPDESRSITLPPLRNADANAPLPLPQPKQGVLATPEIAKQTLQLLGGKNATQAPLSDAEKALLNKAGTNIEAAKKIPAPEPAPERTLLEQWFGVSARR